MAARALDMSATPPSNAPQPRRAIVVGASSGMGAALVKQLAGEGYRVAALARRADALDALASDCAAGAGQSGGAVFVHAHDVKATDDVPELYERIVRELGGLDLFIFAAGIMPPVGKHEYDTAQDLEVLAINLSGCIAWTNAAAQTFRTQRAGTIVGISSIAGDRGRKGFPVYATSKAAMDCYLESLRNRLSEEGVHVCTIKPGFIDTPMTSGMEGLFWLITASQAAERILNAARSRANVRYVPYRWKWVGLTLKLIPSFIFRKLNF
jgi:NAD(P)-dependent dehydrogenase (short-subunit alcohol dehydrogenase family)